MHQGNIAGIEKNHAQINFGALAQAVHGFGQLGKIARATGIDGNGNVLQAIGLCRGDEVAKETNRKVIDAQVAGVFQGAQSNRFARPGNPRDDDGFQHTVHCGTGTANLHILAISLLVK